MCYFAVLTRADRVSQPAKPAHNPQVLTSNFVQRDNKLGVRGISA